MAFAKSSDYTGFRFFLGSGFGLHRFQCIYILSCNFVILSTMIKKVLLTHELNNAFLVPDNCRATVRTSMSADRGYHLKRLERKISVLF